MPKKKDALPLVYVRKGASLREKYAACREQFTAADLQKFTEIVPMVPADQVVADLEAIHREETDKKKGKLKK